jgi:hypothetical protein
LDGPDRGSISAVSSSATAPWQRRSENVATTADPALREGRSEVPANGPAVLTGWRSRAGKFRDEKEPVMVVPAPAFRFRVVLEAHGAGALPIQP